MKILVTGSSGHLGEAIVRTLRESGNEIVGLDIIDSPHTDFVGSVADREFVRKCMTGVNAVIHAATLHKPHVATHSRQDFVDANITGTLNLLEEAVAADVGAFVFTSTTSVFGDALSPPPGEPAAWIAEDVAPVPKNIYGVTKLAAENLCRLFSRKNGLPTVVLRTSRFFPEVDDSPAMRDAYADENIKANEFLFRRVELADAVSAHLLAAERAKALGYGLYIVSATTAFTAGDAAQLRLDAPGVLRKYFPEFEAEYERRHWCMFPRIDRVYYNAKARGELGWKPQTGFRQVLERLQAGQPVLGPLALKVGVKGYHVRTFAEGPYPVE